MVVAPGVHETTLAATGCALPSLRAAEIVASTGSFSRPGRRPPVSLILRNRSDDRLPTFGNRDVFDGHPLLGPAASVFGEFESCPRYSHKARWRSNLHPLAGHRAFCVWPKCHVHAAIRLLSGTVITSRLALPLPMVIAFFARGANPSSYVSWCRPGGRVSTQFEGGYRIARERESSALAGPPWRPSAVCGRLELSAAEFTGIPNGITE